jgi:hypothetical protein
VVNKPHAIRGLSTTIRRTSFSAAMKFRPNRGTEISRTVKKD